MIRPLLDHALLSESRVTESESSSTHQIMSQMVDSAKINFFHYKNKEVLQAFMYSFQTSLFEGC